MSKHEKIEVEQELKLSFSELLSKILEPQGAEPPLAWETWIDGEPPTEVSYVQA